jgi:hypothetical protein
MHTPRISSPPTSMVSCRCPIRACCTGWLEVAGGWCNPAQQSVPLHPTFAEKQLPVPHGTHLQLAAGELWCIHQPQACNKSTHA